MRARERSTAVAKSIYTYYKERLVELGGTNRCLNLKGISKKTAYDLGRLYEGRDDKAAELIDFLLKGGRKPFPILRTEESGEIYRALSDGTPREGVFGFFGKADRTEREDRLLAAQTEHITALKRETEDIAKETGRHELFVGYPFVFGTVQEGSTKTVVRAPLLLFPVSINVSGELYAEISHSPLERVRINPALVLLYASAKGIGTEDIETELDSPEKIGSVGDIIKYLADLGIDIEYKPSNLLYGYDKQREPDTRGTSLSVRHAAVLGRFPLSGSIYNDYSLLERNRLVSDGINQLLRFKGKVGKKSKQKKKKHATPSPSYAIKLLDYAQSEVVKQVGGSDNTVIYGPPGTGKSQTIVNVITDAMCKGKRVLVVSQKKAALDVVYNRLGTLGKRAVYLTDESREKRRFYETALAAHNESLALAKEPTDTYESEYAELERRLHLEESRLNKISKILTEKRPFGLSLSEMYSRSENYSKSSGEYALYTSMQESKRLLSLSYGELSEALSDIESMSLKEAYYRFMQEKEKNPLIDQMREGLELATLTEVKGEAEALYRKRRGLFNISKHPYFRQVLAYYTEIHKTGTVDRIVRLQERINRPRALFRAGSEKKIKQSILDTVSAVDAYVKDYECLRRVLSEDGYLAVIDNLLRGNSGYLKMTVEAIDSYINQRDFAKLLSSLDRNRLEVLNFAYGYARSYTSYCEAIRSLMKVRIYHELLSEEDRCREELSVLADFPNITARILKLKQAEAETAARLCAKQGFKKYAKLYSEGEDNKDYLYQISKTQKLWPVRKTVEAFGKYLLELFPCWLLSPENVSALLPLEREMFDLVVFDEASQVFIESTIPAIYRGRTVVVAGDDKQLRPSATFMRRYLGADPDREEDYSLQAALEVTSLLDLAVSRYESASLTYHYRSESSELIDFSNYAFYGGALRIAPNVLGGRINRPIERYKVNGKWVDRKNSAEAEKIVELLKKTFKTRKNNESIGIIAFGSEQMTCIADAIDRECARDSDFRGAVFKERSRVEGGEDVSMFIKNLENVQGDERDIIIFSIGYAPNESGRVNTGFGSLSQDGGENRLNVAITRAKKKIMLVTSIEPEELNVDGAKNRGPRLLREYLRYVRAVAEGNRSDTEAILTSLLKEDEKQVSKKSENEAERTVAEEIKERLTKLGYIVDTDLGSRTNRISLAIYDGELDRYLVGVELDSDAFAACDSALERDVYKPKFLEARGWSLIRVWRRDWWLSPQRVIKSITSLAEANKKKYK